MPLSYNPHQAYLQEGGRNEGPGRKAGETGIS